MMSSRSAASLPKSDANRKVLEKKAQRSTSKGAKGSLSSTGGRKLPATTEGLTPRDPYDVTGVAVRSHSTACLKCEV